MAKIFTLLIHKTLGPAIVLRKEGDGIIRVYFSDKIGSKSILESHPFVSSWNLTILDFIKYQLYEGIFDSWTKEKAEPYVDDSHIQLIDVGDDVINARIKGTSTYNVSISIKNSKISFACDCPVSGLCKHMYALCDYLYNTRFKSHKETTRKNETPKINKKDNEFFDMLSSYFYYQKATFDFISFYKIHDYFVSHLEKIEDLLKEIYRFYNRTQYQNRIIQLLLYPLYLNKDIKEAFIAFLDQSLNQELKDMVKEAITYSDKQSFIRNSVMPWYSLAISYLTHYFNKDLSFFANQKISYGFEQDYYLINLYQYLKTYDISIDDVIYLNSSQSFSNYLFIFKSRMDDELLKKENVRYLFLPILGEKELSQNDIPMNLILSYLSTSDNYIKFVPTLTNRFNEIEEKDYQLIAEIVINYTYLSTSEKNRYFDVYYSLASCLPNNQYLLELLNTQKNIRGRY